MKYSILTLFLAFLGVKAQASTISVDEVFSVEVGVVKTVHECATLAVFGVFSHPGDGNCGAYQSFELGVQEVRTISFDGEWTSKDGENFWHASRSTCRAGQAASCFPGASGYTMWTLTPDTLKVRSMSAGLNMGLQLDLETGTGFIEWEDDASPFFGRGQFDIRHAKISSGLVSMPLPNSAMLFLLSMATIAAGLRWKRRSAARH